MIILRLVPIFLLLISTKLVANIESVFTNIYEKALWSSDKEGKGVSGTGSLVKEAAPYMDFLSHFITFNDVRSVVDIGCGDWTFSQHMNWDHVQYWGIDVVRSVIEKNQKRFVDKNIYFIHGNSLEIELPSADLLVCKDVLQHLSHEDIDTFLRKIRKYKHCLITNDIYPNQNNKPIVSGDYRFVDLTQFPFFVDGVKVFTYKSGVVTKQVLYMHNKLPEEKTVLLAILARNKAAVLPHFLKCIENLDYDKKLIGIYINTNNNVDNTKEMLQDWMKEHHDDYRFIVFENEEYEGELTVDPHDWDQACFQVLGTIRNKSLEKAKEFHTDFYFVVDCDNFIAPYTLKDLIAKDRPIIAPLLRSVPELNDPYSNYFCDITENGYYKSHLDYWKILHREKIGTFKVPVVHCTYLIRSDVYDRLNYLDETQDFEFVIFSRNARAHEIDQYICNEKEFGTLLHFFTNVTLQEEKEKVAAIFK